MSSKQDTGPLAELFLSTVPQVMRIVASNMRQHAPPGMDPAYFRLLHILQHHGACRIGDLAEMQAVSTPTMSNTVSTLEERGWITRERDADDRRVVQIALTAEGEAILKDMHREMLARIAERLSGLSQAERDQLASGLDVMKDVFDHPAEKEDED